MVDYPFPSFQRAANACAENQRWVCARFKILDSDMHVMEPRDLWEQYINAKFKSRAPRGVVSNNVRDLRLIHPGGKEWAQITTREIDSARRQNFDKKHNVFGRDAARGWTSGVQLEAMDFEGSTWMPDTRRRSTIFSGWHSRRQTSDNMWDTCAAYCAI